MRRLVNLQAALAKSPHLVPEYIEAQVAFMNAKGNDANVLWLELGRIYSKHYQRSKTVGCIPVSPEAKALAAIFPDEFADYQTELLITK